MRRRVISTHLDYWVDPAVAFSALCAGDGPAFWLDSGFDATTGISCIGTGGRVVTASGGGDVTEWATGIRHGQTIFDFLRQEQAGGACDSGGVVPFPLGWVGWLGYENHGATLGTEGVRDSRYPDAAFQRADRAVVFDHGTQSVTLVALASSWTGDAAAWRDETASMLAALVGAGERPLDEAPTPQHEPEWFNSEDEYLGMIVECQRRIRAGDAYQLCLTTEISARVRPDPVDTYLRLRRLSPSHHGGFLRCAGVSLLSSSPEQFLTVTPGRQVESKPIKGTRRRGATREEDDALRRELVASDKERAENLMIVDLVRNDLSRVCAVGSVTVPHLLEVESYAQVHQLVSTVRGTLSHGRDPIDAVLACFPAGSMTGAPKLSAVQILDSLERRARGIYSGAFGYFGFDGSIDLAMVIRSIVLDERGVTIGTGGGITALSEPQEELEETRIKARALLRALGLIPL